ncbi:uncharacterized protein LOC128558360 [Mercenaria mercenaria]|uniref:uncharacterized protein LOC128558360 n=1 Tax=Mercenaria mercenaria TaxID=6596 RepID=UPI00234F1CA3|nr:uncharacterized protein LOC128558360 [Mercenaria mercenaria]
MVGSTNESEVEIEGIKTMGLIDTGSMITTISVEFFKDMDPKPELLPLEDFNLEVSSANGEKLPFLGYVEVDLKVSVLCDRCFTIPALIVPRTDYNSNVPVIVGTNIIRQLQAEMDDATTEIPEVWNMAFKATCSSSVGIVKSTQRFTLQPMETKQITGFERKMKDCESVVTEPSEKGYSSRFTVCPRVVKLDDPGNTARVPVRVFNMSAKAVEIPEKSKFM